MKKDIFQAIADPTRRAILSLIALQPMTPNAVAAHFDHSRQAISKHIQVLVECRLLEPTQCGREIEYHFNGAPMKQANDWIQQFSDLWEQRFGKLDQILAKSKNKE